MSSRRRTPRWTDRGPVEDALVWLRGRHQVKFGYRLVDRRPSPFIHDNTRSLITFGTSFVNNPLTNTGGTGLAEVLLGYFNSASRGFLLEAPTFKVMEQAAFVQDDVKFNKRLTVNAGLRYEIFHAPSRSTTVWRTSIIRNTAWSTRARTGPAAVRTRRRTTTTSPRASA
jgi:outer membrane receptor protein involved in Fe transport